MFQFGEIVTLALFLVVGVYVLAHRRQITALTSLRPLLPPFLLMAAAIIATVAEGVPGGLATGGNVIFWSDSLAVAQRGGLASQVLNLLEHLCHASSGIWLLVILLRANHVEREARR